MSTPRRALPLLTDLPPAPSRPHTATPRREPRSMRRTGHWNVTWPEGLTGFMHVDAAARDLVTPVDAGANVVADAELAVRVDGTRALRTITSEPRHPELHQLLGHSAGKGHRARLRELLPDELRAGTLTYFLLDDLPGATLVGRAAWHDRPERARALTSMRDSRPRDMSGICVGFRPDGLPAQRVSRGQDPENNIAVATTLATRDDPLGWHEIPGPPAAGPMMRRRRRIDVIDGADAIRVDSMFRDSCWNVEGTEMVIHEYGLQAVVDRSTLTISEVVADPRVLPYPTCPAAAANLDVLRGEPMETLRVRVLQLLAGTDGCTHLNDALRALAEVPVLIATVRRHAHGS